MSQLRTAEQPAPRVDRRAGSPLRRQLRATMRQVARPRAYVGTARELALLAFHGMTYPLGLTNRALPHDRPVRRVELHPALADDGRTATMPVILVHGYVHNRSAFLLMSRVLSRAGFTSVHGFNYNPLRSDTSQIAADLALEVDRLLASTGAERCMIVGHSMGGVIARYYVQELGGDCKVDTVLTLGTPHRGTLTSYLGVGPACAELRPGSALMRRLEESARPSDVRWIAYYSDLDLLVTPAASGKIVHPALDAVNIRVRDTGHMSLLLSGEVLRSVVEHLTDRRMGRTIGVARVTALDTKRSDQAATAAAGAGTGQA
jgi:triacylglycerol lipase